MTNDVLWPMRGIALIEKKVPECLSLILMLL